MKTTRHIRTVAIISLILNAVLSFVAIALSPALSRSTVDDLLAMNAASIMATISASAFVLA